MRSKEIINEYIKKYEDIFRYTNNLKVMKRQVELIKEMELVKKDLEVLEILKKLQFEIYQNQNGCENSWSRFIDINGDKDSWSWYIGTKQSIEISEEEYEKVKEWLKNDK